MRRMNAFELISFCVGKTLNDTFAGNHHTLRKSKTAIKDCKKAQEVNLQRDSPINSNIHVHVFSIYDQKKTFLKVRTFLVSDN